MKIPKEIKAYCPYCKKHTLHQVLIVKKKKASELTQGQRRFRRKLTGYGSFPRPKPDNEKATKRKDIRLKCKECKKQHVKRRSYRAKKFEVGK